jgi:hypothetical protein
MTQAIDPWILSVRSITDVSLIVIGLAFALGGPAGGQEPVGESLRPTLSAPVEPLPPLPGALTEPELPILPSSNVFASALADIAKEIDPADATEFLDTDANSFTFAVRTADKNRVIFESAYTNIKIGKGTTKQSFPESLFRYGLTDRLELRLGYNYETSPSNRDAIEGDIAGNFGINAQQQIYYGFKYQVSRQEKEKQWQPTSAFLFQLHTPIASEQTHTQIRLGYALGWTLPNGWILDTGFRYGTDRELGYNYTLWAPSTVVKIPFGKRKRWYTQFEYFGIVSEYRPRNFSKQFVDTGLHYFITPNWEIGTTVSFGINEQTRGTMINVGTGIQF